MNLSDIFLLFLGGLFGLFLALFVQPLIEDKTQGLLVRIIARFGIRSKESISGNWSSVMLSDGVVLSRENEIQHIQLSEVRTRIAGTFTWKGRTYRLLAKRHNDQYLTGTYEDIRAGYTFQGAFQLRIYPNERIMAGRWIGFNSENQIIEGPWEWRRSEHLNYPFEQVALKNK